MASFLGVLQHIWNSVETFANIAAPAETEIAMIPLVGGPMALVLQAITAMEKILPQSGAGAAKKTAVTAIVNAAHPGLEQSTLSAAIDAVVAGLNQIAAAQATLTPATK